jgi:DNA-directed RNA polymerase alpha subunit
MNNEYVFTLFESAERFGLIFTLTPFGNDIKISIPMSRRFCDKSIAELGLSVRALNGLRRYGALTVSELDDIIMSDDGLLKLRNIGKKSICEIKTKLLNLAYNDLTDKGRLEFWHKFVELNADIIPCGNGGAENA